MVGLRYINGGTYLHVLSFWYLSHRHHPGQWAMWLLYVKELLWSPVEKNCSGRDRLISYNAAALVFSSYLPLVCLYIYLLKVKLKNWWFLDNNSGYKTLAISCTPSFLWERKRKTWWKVLELYPWWWASGCYHYRSVLFWSELSVIRMLNLTSYYDQIMQFHYDKLFPFQVRMVQLMGKGKFGGTCGGEEP